MATLLSLLPISGLDLALAVAITLFGGFVKGATGFAMPLIMVSGLSTFLTPELAVAAMILPTAVTNIAQSVRWGWRAARAALVDHRRYVLIVCATIVFSAQLLPVIPSQALYLILGIAVTGLSVVQLLGLRFRIPAERRTLAEWGIGGVAGFLGGLTGTWGPPTVLYLLALDTPKQTQIVVQGVVYGLGSVTLLAAHLRSGVLDATTAPLSATLIVPGFIGLLAGFWYGNRLDQVRFRRITLAILVLAGLNLLRRGLSG